MALASGSGLTWEVIRNSFPPDERNNVFDRVYGILDPQTKEYLAEAVEALIAHVKRKSPGSRLSPRQAFEVIGEIALFGVVHEPARREVKHVIPK